MDKIITTSWDDGHPLDFRLAELLEKYNLKGTFYVPKHNSQNMVMEENEIRVLSERHEIGGHTLNHVNLKMLDNQGLRKEIHGSYQWLKEITGKNPNSFCPPFGAYNDSVLAAIKHAGFTTIRTTQLLSIDQREMIAHTTIQLYNHSTFTYAKHLIKRARVNDLIFWLSSGPTSKLLKLTDYYLSEIDERGGCFHLWGHSWEIEKFNLWGNLELLLKHLSQRDGFKSLTNEELKKSSI